MRFFISSDIKKNSLLRLIIVFTVVFFVFLWITNLLLYLQVGFSYESVVEYYRGSEETVMLSTRWDFYTTAVLV